MEDLCYLLEYQSIHHRNSSDHLELDLLLSKDRNGICTSGFFLIHSFLSTADQQHNAVTRDIPDTTNIDNRIPQIPQVAGEPHFHVLPAPAAILCCRGYQVYWRVRCFLNFFIRNNYMVCSLY